MTATLTPSRTASSPAGSDAGARSPARAAPALAVLALPTGLIPTAGHLLRRGPALAIAEVAPDPVPVSAAAVGVWALPSEFERLEEVRQAAAERALEATVNAGFELHAVETLTREQLRGRLRGLRDAGAGCVVVADRGAGEVRRLARAAQAPVLVLPRDAAAAGGPAVLDAGEAGFTARAAALALATEDVLVVSSERDDVLRVAAAHEGILVIADASGWRAPRLLRAALAERRPVLLVPASEGASRAHRKYSGRLT